MQSAIEAAGIEIMEAGGMAIGIRVTRTS
jgi:hypothetical protein